MTTKNSYIHPIGKVEYKNDAGDLHREDGPAVFFLKGNERVDKQWWWNGQLIYSSNVNNINKKDLPEEFLKSILLDKLMGLEND